LAPRLTRRPTACRSLCRAAARVASPRRRASTSRPQQVRCAACVKQKRVCEGGFVAAPFKKNQCASCQHSSAEHSEGGDAESEKKTPTSMKEASVGKLPQVAAQKETSASQLPTLSPRKSDQPTPLRKSDQPNSVNSSAQKIDIPGKKGESGTIRKMEGEDASKNPRAAIACLEANDPSFVAMLFHNNTSFAMKHAELTALVATALASNTKLERLELVKCDLDHRDAIQLAGALEKNTTLRVLNLQNNKISNEGASAIAHALRANKSVTELNLLGQQQAAFGEPCLQNFIDLFDYNVTLTKIIWRLDSRKSFAINKLIVRNNTIKKWIHEGKSVADIYPKNANVSTDELKQRLQDRGSTAIDMSGDGENGEEEDVGPEAARRSQGGGLGECPASANAFGRAAYNEFVTKVDKKWRTLQLPLVAGTTAVEGEKILASMGALRTKVEAAAIPELTARFRELNKIIPNAVNDANAAANSKVSKIVCDKCKTPMTGAGCETGGKHFHKSCWKCESCKAPLPTKPLVVAEKLYCDDCGRIAFSKNGLKK
jgi:hypothetical protein